MTTPPPVSRRNREPQLANKKPNVKKKQNGKVPAEGNARLLLTEHDLHHGNVVREENDAFCESEPPVPGDVDCNAENGANGGASVDGVGFGIDGQRCNTMTKYQSVQMLETLARVNQNLPSTRTDNGIRHVASESCNHLTFKLAGNNLARAQLETLRLLRLEE